MLNAKREKSSKEEQASHAAKRSTKAQKYIEKWSRNDVGEGLIEMAAKDYDRAVRTAWMIENQETYLKTLREDTIRANFGTVPEHVLKIVRIGAANSNRGNIFTEYPLETTDDAIYYLEYNYGKTLRDATAGENFMENISQYYSSEDQTLACGTGNGATVVFGGTFTAAPVVPFTIKVFTDNKIVATDDGSGALVGAGISAGTINYTTGLLSITFSVAPATGVVVTSNGHFDSEIQALYPQIGTVDITISKRRFRARQMPLGYNYTRLVEAQLSTQGFGDADSILINGVGLFHAKRKDFRAIQTAKSYALKNPITTFNADFGAAGEVSDKSHAQRILTTIDNLSGKVGDAVGRGGLNKIIAGRSAITYLRKHDLFVGDSSQPRVGGTYLAGKLGDHEVYVLQQDQSVSSLLSPSQLLLTYKDPQNEGDVALAYGILTEFSDSLAYPQHRIEGQISSVEDYIVFNENYLQLLNIDNITL